MRARASHLPVKRNHVAIAYPQKKHRIDSEDELQSSKYLIHITARLMFLLREDGRTSAANT